MLEWLNNPDVTKYLRLGKMNATIEDALFFIEKAQHKDNDIHQAVVDDQDCYLGTVSLKNINRDKGEAEYAISMHPSAFGTDASRIATDLILQRAFLGELLKRVFLYVLEDNHRAVRFYEKYGFTYTQTTVITFEGEEKNLRWYEITGLSVN